MERTTTVITEARVAATARLSTCEVACQRPCWGRRRVPDEDDARAMLDRGLVVPERVFEFLDAIRPNLNRYPAVDAETFERKVLDFLADKNEQA